jgi:two-component system nitrate/nitrite response regulator NarL
MAGHTVVDGYSEEAAVTGAAVVRVVVADDHPAMRGALARILAHDRLELLGEAPDGEQTLSMIESLSPDVALLDMRMPRLGGLGVLRRLREAGSAVQVLLISGNDDCEIAHEAIGQGAAGFLSKDAQEHEIASAIIEVSQGRSVLSASLQSGVLDLIRRGSAVPVKLSAREHELLELAAEGLSSPEIADRLHLSPNTVKTYWQRLYEKPGTSDRGSASAEAIRRGLLE